MIKKVFITAVVLLAVYSIVLKFLPEGLDTDQSQYGENVIKAQNFIYNSRPEETENVIVGTSLSTRIFTDSLGQGFVNLAFSGSTIWDGLRLIKAKAIKPKRVFIENTFLFKNTDYNLTDYVTNGFHSKLKSALPVLLEENQPVGVLKAMLVNQLRGKQNELVIDSTAVNINPEILEIQSEYFVHDYIEENYEYIFTRRLRAELDELLSNGIEVILYEMPLHPDFCSSEVVRRTRVECQKLADEAGIRFITLQNCEFYQTNDGIHLVEHSGLKFTRYLKSKI